MKLMDTSKHCVHSMIAWWNQDGDLLDLIIINLSQDDFGIQSLWLQCAY